MHALLFDAVILMERSVSSVNVVTWRLESHDPAGFEGALSGFDPTPSMSP